jgi:ribosomal protein S10
MSLLETVQQKLKKKGITELPKSIKNIIEFAERHGADVKVEVEVPRPRDPVLLINGRVAASWIKL